MENRLMQIRKAILIAVYAGLIISFLALIRSQNLHAFSKGNSNSVILHEDVSDSISKKEI